MRNEIMTNRSVLTLERALLDNGVAGNGVDGPEYVFNWAGGCLTGSEHREWSEHHSVTQYFETCQVVA